MIEDLDSINDISCVSTNSIIVSEIYKLVDKLKATNIEPQGEENG